MIARDVILSKQQSTERDEIEDVIESKFINDFGTIIAMHGQETCDVEHAVQLSTADGSYLPPTLTKNVEIIWPTSSLISIKWDLAVGDQVRLIGFKHYINTLGRKDFPIKQQVYNSYNQETLKAIPCGVFNDEAGVKISITAGGVISIDAGASGTLAFKNAVTSLKTIVNQLMDDLTTLSATPTVPGAPAWSPGAATWPALKLLIDSLIGA